MKKLISIFLIQIFLFCNLKLRDANALALKSALEESYELFEENDLAYVLKEKNYDEIITFLNKYKNGKKEFDNPIFISLLHQINGNLTGTFKHKFNTVLLKDRKNALDNKQTKKIMKKMISLVLEYKNIKKEEVKKYQGLLLEQTENKKEFEGYINECKENIAEYNKNGKKDIVSIIEKLLKNLIKDFNNKNKIHNGINSNIEYLEYIIEKSNEFKIEINKDIIKKIHFFENNNKNKLGIKEKEKLNNIWKEITYLSFGGYLTNPYIKDNLGFDPKDENTWYLNCWKETYKRFEIKLSYNSESKVLKGHKKNISSVIQLRDGSLASCSLDNTIRIWDINKKEGKECIKVLQGHTKNVNLVIQLRDGSLASCSWDDDTIRIWDINKKEGKECIKVLKGHKYSVSSVIQLRDGSLASCSLDNTIRIWDINKKEGKECIKVLQGHTKNVKLVIQLRDGSLASGSRDNTIRIWNINKKESKECIKVLEGHTNLVESLIQLRDGSLASSSMDNTIRIWDINKKEDKECIKVLQEHTSFVESLIQLKDGSLASGSWDNTIRIWDINKKEGKECIKVLQGHINGVKLVIQLKDGSLASGSWDNTIRIWDINKKEGKECIKVLQGHINGVKSVIQLRDGSLASGSWDNTIRIWNWIFMKDQNDFILDINNIINSISIKKMTKKTLIEKFEFIFKEYLEINKILKEDKKELLRLEEILEGINDEYKKIKIDNEKIKEILDLSDDKDIVILNKLLKEKLKENKLNINDLIKDVFSKLENKDNKQNLDELNTLAYIIVSAMA